MHMVQNLTLGFMQGKGLRGSALHFWKALSIGPYLSLGLITLKALISIIDVPVHFPWAMFKSNPLFVTVVTHEVDRLSFTIFHTLNSLPITKEATSVYLVNSQGICSIRELLVWEAQ